MTPKTRNPSADTAQPEDETPSPGPQLSALIKESAQQIWQAGLGAFAKAQAEGGKAFESLVKEGGLLQRKTQTAAGDRFTEAASRMSDMASGISSKASGHWDKLESIFEDRVAKALQRLDVPTAQQVDALAARIDALERSLRRATAGKGTGTEARAARPAARRAAEPAGAKRATTARATAGTGRTGKAAADKQGARPASKAAPRRREGTAAAPARQARPAARAQPGGSPTKAAASPGKSVRKASATTRG